MGALKVLIIDDDRDMRMALNARLRGQGYETASAEDGMSAIAIALREEPDVILLDIHLPAGDGFVVLDRIGNNLKLSEVPVIAISADDADGTGRRALAAGAVAYFQKPIDNETLLLEIAQRTAGHRAG